MKRILLSFVSIVGAFISAFIIETVALVVINVFDNGFIDRYNSSDAMKTQGGIIVYLITLVLFVVALFFIWKTKSNQKK